MTIFERYDQRLQEQVIVPSDMIRRARQRFFANEHRKVKLVFGLSPAIAVVALTAIILTQSIPSKYPSLTFLQTAQAAYADMQTKATNMGDLVRHRVETVAHTGTINPGSESYETWQNADASRVLTKTTANKYGTPPWQLSINGDQYVPPAYVQKDDTTPPEFSFPADLNGVSISADPDDHQVSCVAFDRKSGEQVAHEHYLDALEEAAGFGHPSLGSAEKTIDLLIQGQQAGYVSDLGLQEVDETTAHLFQVVINVPDTLDATQQKQTVRFGFDPDTYLLKMMDVEFQDNTDQHHPTDTHDHYVISTDELIDAAHAPLVYKDPTAAGLVIQPAQTNNQATYEITEPGCYRSTIDGVKRLPPEEESAVMNRINNPAISR